MADRIHDGRWEADQGPRELASFVLSAEDASSIRFGDTALVRLPADDGTTVWTSRVEGVQPPLFDDTVTLIVRAIEPREP